MSASSWNAGIIRPVPVAPTGPYQDGAAPGVWTLDQVAYWQKQGLWPIAGNVNPTGRGLFFGGRDAADNNTISYVLIATTGNTTDFGDISSGATYLTTAFSSATRALIAGNADRTNQIQYVEIATSGNTVNFGTLSVTVGAAMSCANTTRGIVGGGFQAGNTPIATIGYVTIATLGNAVSFGSLTRNTAYGASCSSPTRGIFGGGISDASATINVISYITIASTGDAVDFGDLLDTTRELAACASSTRGVFAGGQNNNIDAGITNILCYVTIASTGDASDFGDLTVKRKWVSGTSNAVRGVFGPGQGLSSTATNVIDYITIASTGNAVDFGDLAYVCTYGPSATSGSHGGLQ